MDVFVLCIRDFGSSINMFTMESSVDFDVSLIALGSKCQLVNHDKLHSFTIALFMSRASTVGPQGHD